MYRWVEHMAELELDIEASSQEAVFQEALAALAELLDAGAGEDIEVRQVELEAAGADALLAEWLGELAYLAEVQGFVPEHATELALGDGVLHATVEGHAGEPRHLVKAVTLHRLLFAPAGRGYRARVVLDV